MADTKIKQNKRPIGVFDSGVGGLSVLRELQKILPNEDFVFLADQKYVPYGEKTKEELMQLVYKITDYFIEYHNVKMVVVACNTATCNAIAELRAKYLFPIVGTVPAVKLAAKKTKSGTVAVICTPSTSESEILKKLISEHCMDVNVLNIGCKNLENAVETGELNGIQVNMLLQKYLKGVVNSHADHLVLGCTHYPFLKEKIQKIVGPKVKLLDGGRAIAKRSKSLIKTNFLANSQKKVGKTIYFTTSNHLQFSRVATLLLKTPIKAKKAIVNLPGRQF